MTIKTEVLEIIQSTKKETPITVDQIHQVLGDRGRKTTKNTVQVTIYQGMKKNDDGYQYVHQVKMQPGSRLQGYYWDTQNKSVVNTEKKPAKKKEIVPIKKSPTTPDIHVFARVFDVPEHGFVLIVDQEGNVIKGKRMTDG